MTNKFTKILVSLIAGIILIAGMFGCNQSIQTTTSSPATTSQPAKTEAPTTTVPTTTVKTTTATTPATATAPRTITDMYGTKLTVPGEINRVIATGPVETQLLYIIAPEKLVGLSSAWNGNPSYISAKYKDLTIIGNSSSGSFNFETAIVTKPDVVLEGKTKNLATDREKFGTIPVVGVNAGDDLLTMYQDEIKYVADLLGVSERGNELSAYYQDAMNYVKKVVAGIPDSEKLRVYYAEGNDGLQTDALGSWHTNLLAFCGGINVANVQVSNTSQAVQVSMEQIYSWNTADPIDMIIIGRTSQATTYQLIMNSSTWQKLDCVKVGQVYIRPDNPTSWFDGPPGYGQILGMYWMVNKLYPNYTKDLDVKAKVKEFYSKFLHYDLSDKEAATLLANPS
jgi:iron complex transport system substrate-binding protein